MARALPDKVPRCARDDDVFPPLRPSVVPSFPLSPFPSSFPRDLPTQAALRLLPDGAPRAARRCGGHPQQRARAPRPHGAGREHGTHADLRRARDRDVRPERAHLARPERPRSHRAEGVPAHRGGRRLLAGPLARRAQARGDDARQRGPGYSAPDRRRVRKRLRPGGRRTARGCVPARRAGAQGPAPASAHAR